MPPIFEDVMLAVFYEISTNKEICTYKSKHILGGEDIKGIEKKIIYFFMPRKFHKKNFLIILDGNLKELDKYLSREGYDGPKKIPVDKGKMVYLYEKTKERYKKYILVIDGKIEDILEIPHIRIDKSYKKRDKIEKIFKKHKMDFYSLKQRIKGLKIAELLNRLSKDLNI